MEITRHFTSTVLIVYKDRVLLHQHKKFNSLLPVGGHLERDELPEEAALREVKEETGLSVTLYNPDPTPFPDVQVLVRLRTIAGSPALEETIAIPMEIMPELMISSPLPNALYPYYQSRYGLHVARTEERVSATAATERQARKLEIAAGAPLLRIERTAYDLNARPIEHRVSHFVTNGLTFRVDLR